MEITDEAQSTIISRIILRGLEAVTSLELSAWHVEGLLRSFSYGMGIVTLGLTYKHRAPCRQSVVTGGAAACEDSDFCHRHDRFLISPLSADGGQAKDTAICMPSCPLLAGSGPWRTALQCSSDVGDRPRGASKIFL